MVECRHFIIVIYYVHVELDPEKMIKNKLKNISSNKVVNYSSEVKKRLVQFVSLKNLGGCFSNMCTLMLAHRKFMGKTFVTIK